MTTSVLERPAPMGRDYARTNPVQDRPGPAHAIHVIRPTEVERRRYEELLALSTAELRARAADEIRSELALASDRQREAIHTRLGAWLEMDAEDARILARVWDEAATRLPAEDARRRFEAECDAMLHGFAFRDFTRLAELMPWVRSRLGLALFASTAHSEAA